MAEVNSIEQSPILYKSTYLYMELCDLAAKLRLEINYNQRAEMRNTIKLFRQKFYELYYLVRIQDQFDKDLKKEIEKWQTTSFKKDIPFKFYIDTLKLFDKLSISLEDLNIIKL